MKASVAGPLLCSIALLAGISLPSLAHAQQIEVNKANRSIAVTATAEAKAPADRATVHIGYIVYGPNEDAAYAAGSKASNAIVAALRSAGIPADAIESQNQAISPVNQFNERNWTAEEKAERKFQVEQSWTAKCAAKDAAGVLDAAVKAGANQSGQIDWSVTDENALEAKATALALTRAHQIAEKMAGGLSTTLGPLLYASNQTPSHPVVPLMRGAAMAAFEKTEPKPLSISPREISQSATVYAVFAIQ